MAQALVKKAGNSAKSIRATAPTAAPELTPLQKATGQMERYSKAFRKIAQIAAKATADVAPLKAEMEAAKLELNRYADSVKAEWGTAKTLKMAGGVIGWKLGTKGIVMPEVDPSNEKKLATLNANFLGAIETYLPDAVSKEVDNKKLITAWEGKSDDNLKLVKRLKQLGVSMTQPDNFFVTASK